jgi:hypothetical protein
VLAIVKRKHRLPLSAAAVELPSLPSALTSTTLHFCLSKLMKMVARKKNKKTRKNWMDFFWLVKNEEILIVW